MHSLRQEVGNDTEICYKYVYEMKKGDNCQHKLLIYFSPEQFLQNLMFSEDIQYVLGLLRALLVV